MVVAYVPAKKQEKNLIEIFVKQLHLGLLLVLEKNAASILEKDDFAYV